MLNSNASEQETDGGRSTDRHVTDDKTDARVWKRWQPTSNQLVLACNVIVYVAVAFVAVQLASLAGDAAASAMGVAILAYCGRQLWRPHR